MNALTRQLPVPTEPDVRGPADDVGGGVRAAGERADGDQLRLGAHGQPLVPLSRMEVLLCWT